MNQGETVFSTFRSFFADERLSIHAGAQPYDLTDVFGMSYDQFTRPVNVTVEGAQAQYWMELLHVREAECVASYTHRYWGSYAVVTRNAYGKGHAWYLGTMLPAEKLKEYLLCAAADAALAPPAGRQWPLILRNLSSRYGENDVRKNIA